MSFTPQQILEICDRWQASVTRPNGALVFTTDTQQHRLLRNGVLYQDLPFDSICTALAATTKTLLLPGQTVNLDSDHLLLWSWCGQVLFNYNEAVFGVPQEMDLRRHFLLTLHAALAHMNALGAGFDGHLHHERQVVENTPEILCHLSFPLLEAIAKRACAQFVAADGTVLNAFDKANGKSYQPGAVCSSLFDLLTLTFERVLTDNVVVGSGNAIKNHVASISGKLNGFRAIQDWRNQSLHGTQTATPIGGTVLNLALLIAFAGIADSYEQRRVSTIRKSEAVAKMGVVHDCTLYPPR